MRWVRVDSIWDEVGLQMHKESADVAAHVESLLGWGQPILVNGDQFECLKNCSTDRKANGDKVKT